MFQSNLIDEHLISLKIQIFSYAYTCYFSAVYNHQVLKSMMFGFAEDNLFPNLKCHFKNPLIKTLFSDKENKKITLEVPFLLIEQQCCLFRDRYCSGYFPFHLFIFQVILVSKLPTIFSLRVAQLECLN